MRLAIHFVRISIHVPLRGGRRPCNINDVTSFQFQSTSPYAGDDLRLAVCSGVLRYFNPRPPTRGTTFSPREPLFRRRISIHVPLRGGRLPQERCTFGCPIFQSTSPYAGDDLFFFDIGASGIVFQSTSPYAGDDYQTPILHQSQKRISIHVPLRGGRPLPSSHMPDSL